VSAPSRIERIDRQRQVRLFAGVAPGYALADRLEALKKALAVDPDAHPESRLPIVLARRRAAALLTQANRYFLLPEGDQQP